MMCFLALAEVQAVFSKSILRALLLYAATQRSSNVSKSIDGFRYLTKNVSAINTELFISCGLSKFSIKEEVPGLWRAFRAASLVNTLLVVSHPVSAWSAGRHLVNSFPREVNALEGALLKNHRGLLSRTLWLRKMPCSW